MKIKNIKSGFSLIEISLVILVIGILVIGISKGKNIIQKSRLTSAQNITINSPVRSVEGLVAWWETVMPESFNNVAHKDNDLIQTWYDISEANVLNPANASQSISALRPFYKDNIINNLPVLYFNKDYLSFDGSSLITKDFVIFIVEKKTTTGNEDIIIGGTSGTTNGRLHVGYLSDGTIVFRQYGNDHSVETVTTSYSLKNPIIHTFYLSSDRGKSYYYNGQSKSLTFTGSGSQTATLQSYSNARIGDNNGSSGRFEGYIAEIIIYNKAIKNSERESIENYLKKKWQQ